MTKDFITPTQMAEQVWGIVFSNCIDPVTEDPGHPDLPSPPPTPEFLKFKESWDRMRDRQFVPFFLDALKGQGSEFRFQGQLGFGGKIWVNNGRIYVSQYSEDETPESKWRIQEANDELEALVRRSVE